MHRSSLVSTRLAPERAGVESSPKPTGAISLSDLDVHGSSLKATRLTPQANGASVTAAGSTTQFKPVSPSAFSSAAKPGERNGTPLLYVSPTCPHAHKAWLAVLETCGDDEINIRFEDLSKKSANLQDAFGLGTYEAEPLVAKVPVLQHDGRTLVESILVATYVAETFGKDGKDGILYQSPTERYAGSLFASQFNALTPLYMQALKAKSQTEVESKLDALRAQLRQCERTLAIAQRACLDADSNAGDGPFTCGNRYTLAEITTSTMIPRLALVLGSYRQFRFHKELEVMGLTRLAKWVDACAERPAFKKSQQLASDATGKDYGSAIIDFSGKFVTFK